MGSGFSSGHLAAEKGVSSFLSVFEAGFGVLRWF